MFNCKYIFYSNFKFPPLCYRPIPLQRCRNSVDIAKAPFAPPALWANINRFVRNFHTESGVFVQNSVCDRQKQHTHISTILKFPPRGAKQHKVLFCNHDLLEWIRFANVMHSDKSWPFLVLKDFKGFWKIPKVVKQSQKISKDFKGFFGISTDFKEF